MNHAESVKITYRLFFEKKKQMTIIIVWILSKPNI